MIKYLILLLCIYLYQSRCVLSYESIDTIPINKISMKSFYEGEKRSPFDFFIYLNNSELPTYIYENVTEFEVKIDVFSVSTGVTIQWINTTEMEISPYFNMWILYINDKEIKYISKASKSYGYVSYIQNECGSDIYDISMSNLVGPYMYDPPILVLKLDTARTYVNWKI